MSAYWPEFVKVVTAHLLAMASPGPDFAVVLHQAVTHGRRTALWTALGVSTPICFHVAYSLFGLALLFHGSASFYEVIKFAGASYLAWLGYQCLKAQRRSKRSDGLPRPEIGPSARSAWRTGLFTNALNPKAALFFIAFFATLVSPETPPIVRAGYGLWICVANLAWFSLVAYCFTRRTVRETFGRWRRWIERGFGLVFILQAALLVCSRAPLPASVARERVPAHVAPAIIAHLP